MIIPGSEKYCEKIPFYVFKVLILVLSLPLLHELVKVFLHVFKHKVKGIVLSDHLGNKKNT